MTVPPSYRQACYSGGMTAQKTSIALDKNELAAAKKAAAAQNLSLSGFLSRLVQAHVAQQARFEAMDRFLSEHAPGFRLSDSARASVEAEWNAPLKPVRPKRRRAT